MGVDMPWMNNGAGGWTLGTVPDLAGPEDLADIVLDRISPRKPGAEPGLHLRISQENVRQLIKLAYFASHRREEGQYVTCTLHAPGKPGWPKMRASNQDWPTVRFAHPIPLKEVDAIRKLASAVGPYPNALIVEEDNNGNLVLTGLTTVSRTEAFRHDVQRLFASEKHHGLSITIISPGVLRAHDFTLNAGRIRWFVGGEEKFFPFAFNENERFAANLSPYCQSAIVTQEYIKRMLSELITALIKKPDHSERAAHS